MKSEAAVVSDAAARIEVISPLTWVVIEIVVDLHCPTAKTRHPRRINHTHNEQDIKPNVPLSEECETFKRLKSSRIQLHEACCMELERSNVGCNKRRRLDWGRDVRVNQ